MNLTNHFQLCFWQNLVFDLALISISKKVFKTGNFMRIA